jgi:hypothetical protein
VEHVSVLKPLFTMWIAFKTLRMPDLVRGRVRVGVQGKVQVWPSKSHSHKGIIEPRNELPSRIPLALPSIPIFIVIPGNPCGFVLLRISGGMCITKAHVQI